MSESDRELMLGVREQVTKLSTQLDGLREEFRRVANGDGFNRCGQRLVRLEQVEEDVDNAHARISADRKWRWGLVCTTALVLGQYIVSLLKAKGTL